MKDSSPSSSRSVRTYPEQARKIIFWAHQIVGLTLGLFLGLLSLTGSLLIFGDYLDKVLYPHLLQVSPPQPLTTLSAESLWSQLDQNHLTQNIQRIRMPRDTASTYEVCFQNPEVACLYVNPSDSQILGSRVPNRSFKRQLFLLHSHLLAGDVGEIIIGILGVLLLIMSLSGLWLWWPLRRFKSTTTPSPRRKPWAQFSFRLHRWLGFGVCGFLVLTSITGVSLAFEKPVERFFNWICHSPQRPQPPQALPLTKKPEMLPTLSDFMAAANQVLPSGKVTFITWPKRPYEAVTVRKKMPDEWHPNGRSFVYLDPYTAQVLSVEESKNASIGTKLHYLFHYLHTGSWGNSFSQILQCFVGMAPFVLFISSLYMWRNRRQYQNLKARS